MPSCPSESEALKHWHLFGVNRIIGSYTSSPSPPLIFNISSSHHIIWYDTPPALGYGVPWWLDDSVKIKNLNLRLRLASIWINSRVVSWASSIHFNDSNSGSEALKTLQSSSPAVAHPILRTSVFRYRRRFSLAGDSTQPPFITWLLCQFSRTY